MKVYPITQVLIISIAVISVSLLYFFYPATNDSFYPRCLFHAFTGLYCPGCGSQRAVSALLHGHLWQAMDLNILMVASLPFIIYSAYVFTWNAFSEKKKEQKIFYSPVFIKVFIAIVLIFWFLRNLPLWPFSWLAP